MATRTAENSTAPRLRHRRGIRQPGTEEVLESFTADAQVVTEPSHLEVPLSRKGFRSMPGPAALHDPG